MFRNQCHITIKGRRVTYLGLKTTHEPLLADTISWFGITKRDGNCVFNTSTVGISEAESWKEGRFQIRLWEQGLIRPTAFSFKQTKSRSEQKFWLLLRGALCLWIIPGSSLLSNIVLGDPRPGSNCCKLPSQEHAVTVNQAYRKSFGSFSICFTFNLLTPQDFFKIPRI